MSVQERSFLVRGVVLAANSDYFKAMFLREMKQKQEDQVTIEDIDLSITELMIDFCYTREISLNHKNYPDLFLSAQLETWASLLRKDVVQYEDVDNV